MGQDDSGSGTEDSGVAQSLCRFLRQCPSAFHTVRAIGSRLERAGFHRLRESDSWHLSQGEGYYVTRNGSSVIAFVVGEDMRDPCFSIAASHGDSPTFKVKSVPELVGPGEYVRLNVEGYGGMIERTWLDRPLSLAGRVMVEEDGDVRCVLFAPDEDLLLMPSVSIHQDRNVNSAGALNRQVDLCPLFSCDGKAGNDFVGMLAKRLGVTGNQVLAHDLVLVNRQLPTVWGSAGEFVSGPRLDDLQCTFAAVEALLAARRSRATKVCACFDSEEIGSGSMQGALSTFLPGVLERLCDAYGLGRSALLQAIDRSFLVSCDNAHAVHPNHPELYDDRNRAWLNRGVVIKEAARQSYVTNAVTRAFFGVVCRRAEVPTQTFANRSDQAGGSTLGNLLMRQLSMRSVDVGLPQLAMHSSYETAGMRDTAYMVRALREFFSVDYSFDADGSFWFADS